MYALAGPLSTDLPLPASTPFSTAPAVAQPTFPSATYTPQRLPLTVTFSHRGTLPDDAPAVAPNAATHRTPRSAPAPPPASPPPVLSSSTPSRIIGARPVRVAAVQSIPPLATAPEVLGAAPVGRP